jgi:molybdenum cofactor guanylyltransferase
MGNNTPRVASLILAGGQSRRMGQDKALLSWQGKTLLQRVYGVAAACTTPVYILTPWPERYQTCLGPETIAGNAPVWLQEHPVGAGPLLALTQAFSQLTELGRIKSNQPGSETLVSETLVSGDLDSGDLGFDWLLLLACDLPCLDLDSLQIWQQSLIQQPPAVLAVIPQHPNGQWEPLCGFYRPQVRAVLQDQNLVPPTHRHRSFQTWLNQLPSAKIHSLPLNKATAQMLWNCNTPDDMNKLS